MIRMRCVQAAAHLRGFGLRRTVNNRTLCK